MKLQNKLKIVAISDLHGILPQITESADIMLIAGDIVPLKIQFNKSESKKWFEGTFAEWIQKLPVNKVYMVAGNHDAWFEGISKSQLDAFIKACNYKISYLCNEVVSYILDDGTEIKIFGTPYCHIFGRWAFMREEDYMINKFKDIPDECDIIISHDPPFDISDADKILQSVKWSSSTNHLGNIPLTNRLNEINYKLVVCGHIHSGDHNLSENNIVNVSIVDENYELAYPPFYTELSFEQKLSKKDLKYKITDGIISKELFVEAIEVINKKFEYNYECNKAFEKIFEDGSGYPNDFFIVKFLLDFLNRIFDQDKEYSDIDYFIYELDFGKRWTERSLTQNGVPIDISTSEKLYDYLIKGLNDEGSNSN